MASPQKDPKKNPSARKPAQAKGKPLPSDSEHEAAPAKRGGKSSTSSGEEE